jgi:hypothetical protein
MSKFTPGPWEYLCEIGYAGNYPYSKAHRVKIGKETLTIGCHGYDWEGYDWEGGEEIEANAHLIAAAPEMYKALAHLVDTIKSHNLDSFSKMYCDRLGKAIEKSEAAIAKARGES